MENFTKTFVEKLTPFQEGQKGQKLYWDKNLLGFGLRVTPTSKVFIAQARVNGKSRRVKIGNFGPWTVDDARKKAKALLSEMSQGIDPNREKKLKEIQAKTLKEVVEDYIKDRALKPLTIRDINTHLNGIFFDWKNQPINKITRDKVLNLYRKKSEESPAQANQAFRILRALLNYARAAYQPGGELIIIDNPVNVISDLKIWHSIKPKNRRIPTDKVGKAWNLLQGLRKYQGYGLAGHSLADCVTFALLTGCRWNEARTLTWNNVSLKAGTWHIADPKNNEAVTLPLCTQAQAMLEERPRVKGNNFVFCSDQSKTGFIGNGRFITDQLSKALNVELSPHDLRRTFRSIAAECDVELWRTKLLLNHKVNDDITIEAYTEKQDLEYLRPAIQKIGNWIERQGKIAASPKVVELKGAANG